MGRPLILYLALGLANNVASALNIPTLQEEFHRQAKRTPARKLQNFELSEKDANVRKVLQDSDFSLKNVAPPENDICSNAIEVTPDGQLITGKTAGATYEVFNDPCGVFSTSPGVWYTVLGTGDVMRANTCDSITNFDTFISVYSGDCRSLECVATDDDGCGSVSSLITWVSEPTVTYYIHVQGYNAQIKDDFGLTLSSFQPATNDRCDGAIAMSVGRTLNGSMEFATGDNESHDCFFEYKQPSLWYYIDGTGTALKVSTCSPNSTFTGGIQVFKGTVCSNLVCGDVPYGYGFTMDNECAYPAVSTQFLAEKGVRYYILLIASDVTSGANATFELSATEFEVVANDVCETASPITDFSGVPVAGSTNKALVDQSSCEDSSFSPGVWYRITGTGRPLVASTCSSILNFDSQLNVFSGGCEALECIAFSGGYGACDQSFFGDARVVFNTVEGVEYYILVTGSFQSAIGDFELTIAEAQSPSNDLCSDAIELKPETGGIIGSISDATSFWGLNFSCAYNVDTPVVWYSLMGTGDVYAISTCSTTLNFNSGLSVSTGSCGSQECIAFRAYSNFSCSDTSHSAAPVIISTDFGTEYLIAVEGLNYPAEGDFELTISTVSVPPDD